MGVKHGPNVRKLIAMRAARSTIPAGGGLADAIRAIATPGKLAAEIRAAVEYVEAVLEVVRSSPANPFGDDDEAIAAEILRRVRESGGRLRL